MKRSLLLAGGDESNEFGGHPMAAEVDTVEVHRRRGKETPALIRRSSLKNRYLFAIILIAGPMDFFFASNVSRADTLIFTSIADTEVNPAAPNMNFGRAIGPGFDGSPLRNALLRFGVSVPDGEVVTKATPELSTTSESPDGLAVHDVADTAWGETTTTWANPPEIGVQVATSGPYPGVAYVPVGVTQLIRSRGLISSLIKRPSIYAQAFDSREAASNPPQLVVESAKPSRGRAGANVPITYSLERLPGTMRYIAPWGNDLNECTSGSPCTTLSRAQAAALGGDSIVVRGGTYTTEGSSWSGATWTAETTISKSLTIVAYPGEMPIFDGSSNVTSGPWTAEGSYKYTTYIARPVTNGSGIDFTTGQNLTNGSGGIGAAPDQVWLDETAIQQVPTKGSIIAGTFFVDAATNRLYLLASDVTAANTIHISNLGDWLTISAANVTVKGLTIKRYSNTASRASVLDLSNRADNATLEDLLFEDAAMLTVSLTGDKANLITSPTLTRVTIVGSNWMGIASTYAKDVVFDSLRITNLNRWNEFARSPQSGGIKTGRNYNVILKNSEIVENLGHGVWIDQSSYHVVVASNVITNTDIGSGTCVFFEISDLLYLVNNDINCQGGTAVKLAGSSGLYLINNTIVGGADALGVYADNRSNLTLHCATPADPLGIPYPKCPNSYSSDRWCPGAQVVSGSCLGALSEPVRPDTLDWMPRIDLIINNIVMDASGPGLCGTIAAFCILARHSGAPGSESTMQSIIHPADPARGIPATRIDCNIYANRTDRIVAWQDSRSTSYTAAEIDAWRTYAAGAPISNPEIDANSLADPTGRTYVNADGSPTAELAALHNSACAVPRIAEIVPHVAAGTRHFGITNR